MEVCWSRFRTAFALTLVAAALAVPGRPVLAGPPPEPKSKLASKPALDPELQTALSSAPTAAQWPNSNYAVLLDLGNVNVKSDGTIVAKYRLTYKLFNQRARDELAEVSLPYNSSYQSVHVLSARTIKKDGTVVNVAPEDIRMGARFSEYLMYDDSQAITFSMPSIEDECVIDYTWEEITRPMLMPGQFFTYWGFSETVPVGVSRYVLHVPADKAIKFKNYNDNTLKPVMMTSLDGKTKTYTWESKNIKPVEVEPSMPHDVISWMEVSSLNSWQDIAHWFWDLEQPQAKPTDAIKATVAKLVAGKTTDEEKARAIYDWVANRTRYVGLEFGLSAFRPHAASDVHDKLYGDCKDKATLLITMLGLAGIQAHPVLLHAEERRLIDDGLPRLDAFNHCIALASVGGKDIWLDATAETCAYGDIPNGDRGARALVVHDGTGEFKTIPTYQPSDNGMEVDTKIAVKPDGAADTDVTITMRGDAAQTWRYYLRALTPDQSKEYVQKTAEKFSPGSTLKNYTMSNPDDKDGPFVMKISSSSPNFGKKIGNLLLVPLDLGTGAGRRSNPYTKETRFWPIVEEDASMTHTRTVLTLPDGYTVEGMPGDLNLSGPIEEYHRTIAKSADDKTITITTSSVERAGTVPASDYTKVKGYFADLLKTADDQIVLKPK